ncbi:Protein of unknown function [Pyronema omphalodes CBS 100304]|uniref:Uncharacterized protein n=1 Tax=Pyronema omphalodes (strain CBS 100304) TaxID=1076935 RepID=U4LR55_PYROM|nr:Protein of unknown function [Pyronema omphalodes CBS 100304]
MNFRNGGAD